MKISTKLMLTALSILVAPAFAYSATPREVGELAVHRIEKLIQLKKIDMAFMMNFQSIGVMAMTQQHPQDPAFMSMVAQTDNGKTSPPRVDLFSDADGKVLSNTVSPGTAGAGLNWPGQPALTVGETTFHYLEANAASTPALMPFEEGFKDLIVGQDTRQGTLVGIVLLTSTKSKQTLEFVVGLDDAVVKSWSLK